MPAFAGMTKKHSTPQLSKIFFAGIQMIVAFKVAQGTSRRLSYGTESKAKVDVVVVIWLTRACYRMWERLLAAIGCPMRKTHSMAVVSLGIKNLKGMIDIPFGRYLKKRERSLHRNLPAKNVQRLF
jgi:hypothetical protein